VHVAAKGGHLSVVKLLLKEGAQVKVFCTQTAFKVTSR